MDYSRRSLKMHEEIGDKSKIAEPCMNIGLSYLVMGDLDKSLEYLSRAHKIVEKIGLRRFLPDILISIGEFYYTTGNYDKAVEHLEKSQTITEENGIRSTTYLFLSYKNLGKAYDKKELHTLIKDAENIKFDLNLRLYELLEDTSYLETAYNQVRETADNLKDKAKFLSYPIPKAIVEEWEKNN